MKYNPITRNLFTDENEFLKKLSCPKNANWAAMPIDESERKRTCQFCKKEVVDTQFLADRELAELLKQAPETCLMLNLDQQNLRVINCDI